MKRSLTIAFVLCIVAFGSIAVSAQCDRSTSSPIKCGYYDEGYQDGVTDGNSSQSSDYRRYRSKFDTKYESFYRSGYEAGYDSVRPSSSRWTTSQRSAYDSGYTIGQSDRRNGGQRRGNEGARSSYDQNIGLYFQQGYNDGFDNSPRRYDVPLTGGNPYPTYPPAGGGSGASWSGRVDDRGNIVIHGGELTTQNVSGNGIQTTNQNMNGRLPRRSTIVTATKSEGRGDVSVIQQPDRTNDYTAIIQVSDRNGGAGNYRIDISWGGGGGPVAEEPYRSGRVRWRGRVDQKANIVISGSDVQSMDMSGTGLSGATFDINGVLAQRPGSVNANKRSGRGTVTVIQQPSRDNDYTAIVQVFDPGGGADNYDVEITW